MKSKARSQPLESMVLLQDPDLELSAIDADIGLRIYQEKTQLQTQFSDT